MRFTGLQAFGILSHRTDINAGGFGWIRPQHGAFTNTYGTDLETVFKHRNDPLPVLGYTGGINKSRSGASRLVDSIGLERLTVAVKGWVLTRHWDF